MKLEKRKIKYSDLEVPKNSSGEEEIDLEKELMGEEDELENEKPAIDEALSGFSKEEIQKYLESMKAVDDEDEDEVDDLEESEGMVDRPTVVTGTY